MWGAVRRTPSASKEKTRAKASPCTAVPHRHIFSLASLEGVLFNKNDGGAGQKISKTPLKGTKTLFSGRGQNSFFTPKRYPF